ncbi:MAG: pyridoxal 5'-phosphate synthase glutaminase subunit PdxT [Methanosarcinales archaeon]|nr:pyridoxal 5'-phosphate synthase glutaminase subunit PdxT [Methanosarcinales archaeon]
MVGLKVGVVAIQGDVSEHVLALKRVVGQGEVLVVRKAGVLPQCDGIVLPGGESTTISKMMSHSGMDGEIRDAALSGVPIMATCAGLVLISREIEGDDRVRPLGLMDVTIGRNAFGSQRESFEADLEVKGFDEPYRAVFIRAPCIVRCGQEVEVLARARDSVVAARQGNLFGLAFHPELTDDLRFHNMFMEAVADVL